MANAELVVAGDGGRCTGSGEYLLRVPGECVSPGAGRFGVTWDVLSAGTCAVRMRSCADAAAACAVAEATGVAHRCAPLLAAAVASHASGAEAQCHPRCDGVGEISGPQDGFQFQHHYPSACHFLLLVLDVEYAGWVLALGEALHVAVGCGCRDDLLWPRCSGGGEVTKAG